MSSMRILSLRVAIIVVAGLGIGWMVSQGYFFWLGAVGFVVALALCVVRPILASSLVLSFAFIIGNLLPPVMEVGEFTIRYIDGAVALLSFAIFLRLSIQRRKLIEKEWWSIFRPLFPFLIYVGMSLGLVWIYVPDFLSVSVASYVRLVVTVLLGFLIYMSLETKKDVWLFTRLIVMFAAMSIIVGTWEALASPQKEAVVAGRYGGLLAINTFGLVAGLLVIWAVIGRKSGKPMPSWVIPLLIGLLGLFLSKSGGSILATIGAILFFWIAFGRKGSAHGAWLMRLVLGAVVGGAVAVWALWLLRPADLAALVSLSGGSFAQRAMIAYGALQIFLSHPLWGVGWQASKTKAIIGDPTLNEMLMQAFPKLPAHYFFLENPTSLHNLYMQLLAELGIVGFSLFVYGVAHIGKTIARILKQFPYQSPFRQLSLFNAIGLVYLLIWWNTNALFGGQTESILAVTFLSSLAALWRLQRQNYKRKRYANLNTSLTEKGLF